MPVEGRAIRRTDRAKRCVRRISGGIAPKVSAARILVLRNEATPREARASLVFLHE
jgi:hypothetical protein